VLAGAPVPAIEGRRAVDFLAWVAAESGRGLVLEGEARAAAADTVLHGSVSHLPPRRALAAVLASSGLTCEVRGGDLVVRVAGAGEAPPAEPPL
jgi:hypothetical protein